MSLDNTVVVLKNNKNKHLAVLKDDQEFVTQNGVIKFNDIKELPSVIILLITMNIMCIFHHSKSLFYL
ncbi:MAG: hypothetical protein Ct9H90mP17_2230 [Actinomycetota bacterium]|nr:MAG: hypothetical protein Ct9H90mP17_2230 [Actinomycetota bacterium]